MARYQLEPAPKLGAPAVAAAIAMGASYLLSFTGHGFWGLAAALLGIVAGAVGLLWSAIPHRTGGLLSVASLLLSIIAIIPAVLVILGKLALHL